jgi:hypothetical protein
MNTTAKLNPADLRQFTGTENYYQHALNRNILFTDGAKYVADRGGAYWLLDLVALAQRYEKRLSRQPFQVWALAVRPDRSATITVEDGNYKLLWNHTIEFSDFPAPGITLWFSNNVIYLPSEH